MRAQFVLFARIACLAPITLTYANNLIDANNAPVELAHVLVACAEPVMWTLRLRTLRTVLGHDRPNTTTGTCRQATTPSSKPLLERMERQHVFVSRGEVATICVLRASNQVAPA